MICCLNPRCRKPLNPDGTTVCLSCNTPLVALLRGRYRAIQPLGQGGFGKTYLAADEDRLAAQCVIKQFSPQVQGTKSLEKAVSLFNQEAVRLYELGEHAQIPALLAYFEQDGYLYLVQQFIEGQNLLQEMRQSGPFSERQIRDLLADILPVLRFVHNRQVIHRDITPMNILRRQSDNRLMLIDFGISKQLSESTSGEPGTRIGTEGYAPMEQFRGGRAFPASDLYSLGATCLHLLTETKPDNLYDPLTGTWIWREHLQSKGVLVSDQLAYMLDMMLKDLVNDRYQSADEVMRDLNADYFIPKAPTVKPASISGMGTMANPLNSPRTANPSGIPQPSIPRTPSSRASTPPAKSPTPSQPISKPPTSKPPTSKPPITDSRCLDILTGHTSWVTALAIAPNNQILISGSLDDSVKVWNLEQGDLLMTLPAHRRGVNAIAIHPNGQTFTTGGDDYMIKTWNTNTGALFRTLTGHSRDVNATVISPDGAILASGAEDRTIRLWQMGSGTLLKTLLGVGSMVKALAISPDSKVLISGGFDNQIKIWSLKTGDAINVLSGHLSTINVVAISPNNQFLVSGSKDKTIKLWSFPKGEPIRTLSDHSRDVNALVITPDSKTLVSGSSDTTIKVWDLETGRLLDTFNAHQDSVNALAVSSDGRTLVSGSSDKTIRVWKL